MIKQTGVGPGSEQRCPSYVLWCFRIQESAAIADKLHRTLAVLLGNWYVSPSYLALSIADLALPQGEYAFDFAVCLHPNTHNN